MRVAVKGSMALLPIDISSYNNFRADALARAAQGLGYDVDGYYGYQCWDLAAELWMNIPEFQNSGLWPHTGPNLAAAECWTYSRDVNAGNSFDLIYNLGDVRRGDIIVIGASPISSVGHIAFADQDYANYSYMMLLGQNQVNPDPNYGHIPTVSWINAGSYFLGAFRYKAWAQPVPPTPTTKKHKFPWFIYVNKWRNRNNYGII